LATVFIPTQLRELTAGVASIEVQATSVRQVVAALEEQFPGISARLCVGDALSPALQVSVDGQMSTRGLTAKVKPKSEVHFVPAIGGG
jgi:molybdopterin synthase sulfur carrier subunit